MVLPEVLAWEIGPCDWLAPPLYAASLSQPSDYDSASRTKALQRLLKRFAASPSQACKIEVTHTDCPTAYTYHVSATSARLWAETSAFRDTASEMLI